MTEELLALLVYLGTTGASVAINVKESLDVKEKMESKNDIVIKKYNKLSVGEKLLSNFWNVFGTLCPIYNILHSIGHLNSGTDWLYLEWKKDTLYSSIYANVDVENDKQETIQKNIEKDKQETTQKNIENDKEETIQKVEEVKPSINKFKVKPTTSSRVKTTQFLYDTWVEENDKYNALVNSGTATHEELYLQARKVKIACDKYYYTLNNENNMIKTNDQSMSRRLK